MRKLYWSTVAVFVVSCYIFMLQNLEEWIIEPVEIFENFWIVAKFDHTIATHFLVGLLLGVISGSRWTYTAGIWREVADGYGTDICVGIWKCKQGFDLFDFGGHIAGVEVGILVRPYIINLLRKVFSWVKKRSKTLKS